MTRSFASRKGSLFSKITTLNLVLLWILVGSIKVSTQGVGRGRNRGRRIKEGDGEGGRAKNEKVVEKEVEK